VSFAAISDIHGNAEALKRVLEDIDERGLSEIVCLGDIIGYGPEPLECVDLVAEKCQWALMGNHDFGVLYEPTNFNAMAESAAYWTREQFDAEPDETKRAERYEFLGRLRVRVLQPLPGEPEGAPAHRSVLAVHGSPRRPINEYIFPDDASGNKDKMDSLFRRIEARAMVGHTHVPGVFTDEPDFYPPDELGEFVYKFQADEKAIINVGSVGQPRDHDPRASYAIFHEDRVEFCRVEYDAQSTANKIRQIPELHDRLADRLISGE